MAHGLSCSTACGIFPDQGSNPRPLHWQADSQPLRHQGSPIHFLLMKEMLTRFSCSQSLEFTVLEQTYKSGVLWNGGHHLGLPEAEKGMFFFSFFFNIYLFIWPHLVLVAARGILLVARGLLSSCGAQAQ